MATSNLSSYKLIKAEGSKEYRDGVLAHLRTILKLHDGRPLFNRINSKGFEVKIVHTETGNACTPTVEKDSMPVLVNALRTNDSTTFATELDKSVKLASARGLPMAFLATQLSAGLTPASYKSALNTVRPEAKWAAALPATMSAKKVMKEAKNQTEMATEVLTKAMAGEVEIASLPPDWKYDLPRLLRAHLTPGSGTGTKIDFNTTKTFHCVADPAMHQRPPAIGLAHEMIHAMHAAEGTDLYHVVKNNHHVEEVVTTGFPPYHYEAISDNKLRSQWPSRLELRENY